MVLLNMLKILGDVWSLIMLQRQILREAMRCFTDFWAAYAAVIPEDQHFAVGKETGETAHVERWNTTLRQRLARFVRMTSSFSKLVLMHEACLLLFLHKTVLEPLSDVTTGIAAETHFNCIFYIMIRDQNWFRKRLQS